MTLFNATRDLHHACEAHAVGQAMVNGAVTPQQWADWLWAMRCLHSVMDAGLPAHMERDTLFCADMSVLPKAHASRAALRYARELIGQDCTGTAYVLHGAQQTGGNAAGACDFPVPAGSDGRDLRAGGFWVTQHGVGRPDMKALSDNLQAHLDSGTTTLA